MKWQIGALAVVILAGSLIGVLLSRTSIPEPSRRGGDPIALGGTYSVDNADGGYRVVRVLGLRPDEVRVTLYGDHFPRRPESVTLGELSLEPSIGYAGPGFADLTVTRRAFIAWRPHLIQVFPLSPEEQQAARRWRNAVPSKRS